MWIGSSSIRTERTPVPVQPVRVCGLTLILTDPYHGRTWGKSGAKEKTYPVMAAGCFETCDPVDWSDSSVDGNKQSYRRLQWNCITRGTGIQHPTASAVSCQVWLWLQLVPRVKLNLPVKWVSGPPIKPSGPITFAVVCDPLQLYRVSIVSSHSKCINAMHEFEDGVYNL